MDDDATNNALDAGTMLDIEQDAPKPIRGQHATNPYPQFVPPPAFNKKIDAKDLDKELDKCRHDINKARLDLLKAQKSEKTQKKAHFHIKRLVARVNSINLFRSDVMMKVLAERGRKVYVPRERIITELFKLMATYHDMFSGLLPRSTITNMSDQIGATTYGKKVYFEVAEGVDPKLAKKKAISRTSRGVADMEDWGLIEVTNERDPVTGKYIGAVIRVTQRFFDVLSVSAEDVDKARWEKIRQLQRDNKLPDDIDMEESLQSYIKRKTEKMVAARRLFAQRKRQRRYLKSLNAVEMRERAARDVAAKYGPETVKAMSQQRFSDLLAERQRQLYKLRNDPLMDDPYFDDVPYYLDDIGDLIPYHWQHTPLNNTPLNWGFLRCATPYPPYLDHQKKRFRAPLSL